MFFTAAGPVFACGNAPFSVRVFRPYLTEGHLDDVADVWAMIALKRQRCFEGPYASPFWLTRKVPLLAVLDGGPVARTRMCS